MNGGLAAMLVVMAAGPVGVGAWKRQALTPTFSVEGPVVLKLLVKKGDGKSAPKDMVYWLSKFEKCTYSAMLMPIRQTDRNRATPPLEAFSRGMALPRGGQITSKRIVNLAGGIRGLEWDQQNDLMRSRWRAYEAKKQIHAVNVSWRMSNATPSGMSRFLESVRIN